MLNIPKIATEDLTFSNIEKEMNKLNAENININNWAQEFPYNPEVSFKIAHNGTNVFLQYHVKEQEILAMARGNNSNVWTDSCVEFFISFDDKGYYYNLEQSCIGQALLGYRKGRDGADHAEDCIMDSIQKRSSLGDKNFELKTGDFEWTLLSIIPVSVFWMTKLDKLDGVTAKANFYKCGDNLTTPHFLSWAPIATQSPNFHSPEFFKEIVFEAI